ncbi:MAG: flagellar biosynthesis repressor FlbT [Alphaproteobacteria bacterium]|nr:flagellar biosynthesis repressor FlbT [Alphaproteobacteria bacterium]MBF0374647.1 flagellar biosynthesis repressor FlbT [Alphaproteobacteria bacterium]MBF0394458.1 flagellar biosynthesis repressor FlbT [Alphaproteobacteria bacterium]
MPLKLSLRPHEKILIGTAVVANGASKAELVILNRVPVLRQKDIITEEEADTVAKALYLTVLNMYIHPQQQRSLHKIYFLLLNQLILMPLDPKAIDIMVDMSKKIIGGDHYQALKACRKLIELEAEVLKNVK